MNFQLGAGLTWGRIDLGAARLICIDIRADDPKAADVVARGPHLDQRQVLGQFPGRSIAAGGLCADESGAYVSANGVWFFPLTQAPRHIAGLPPLNTPNDAQGYVWHFEKAATLTALCMRRLSPSLLVRIDTSTGAIDVLAELDNLHGQLQVDLAREAVLLSEPPLVRAFDGSVRATLEDAPRPGAGDAVFWLGGHDTQRLRRWWWQRGHLETFSHEAKRPRLSAAGDLLFVKASTELWRFRNTGDFDRLVWPVDALIETAKSNAWGRSGGPFLSPSGRFVVQTFVAPNALADTVVVDLKLGIVEQLSAFWRMDFAFTSG